MTAAHEISAECRMRQEMYAYVYDHPLVQQLINGYNRAKQCNSLMEMAIQGVENRVTGVAKRAMPVYEYYLLPKVDAVHSTVNRGVENTKRVVDATKSTAVTTTTIGIGAAVVFSQLIISLGLAGTNWILDSAIYVRQVGGNAVGRIKETEKTLEERFRNYVERAQNIAHVPISKLTDQANTFLDIANKVMDRLLGTEGVDDPIDSTVGSRLLRMARRFSLVLQTRAHDTVIDPVTNQMHLAMQQLSSYMKLVDYIHERREWAAQQIEGMHASMNELKVNIENQANELMSRPEEVLMQSVRSTAQSVIENVNALKERGAQLLGDSAASQLDGVVTYLNQLQVMFSEANDIYALRDEVLAETRSKLTDLLNWTSGILVRKRSSSEYDGTPNPPKRFQRENECSSPRQKAEISKPEASEMSNLSNGFDGEVQSRCLDDRETGSETPEKAGKGSVSP